MGWAARRLKRHGGWQAALIGTCAIGVAALPAAADVFAEDTPLEVKLSAPFGAVFRDREKPEYQAATFAYRSAAGDEVTVPLRVRVRGKSRAVACSFPPLLLNFKTGDLDGTVLEGEDRLKLVTHCQSSTAYDNHLRLEYLTYRALNLLTPTSLRARLVTMSYVDSARERDLGTQRPPGEEAPEGEDLGVVGMGADEQDLHGWPAGCRNSSTMAAVQVKLPPPSGAPSRGS